MGVLETHRHPASFRDPAGFLLESKGLLLRAVHPDAAADVDALYASGLHDELVEAGLLVANERLAAGDERVAPGWQLLQPERLPVISYASEWTTAQLRAAALLTLEIQRRALRRGMSLKDASSFNVQFRGARPIFIDILSFTRASGAQPWIAYRQFCEHFLGPLALRCHATESASLGIARLDGLPLPFVSKMLPRRTWLQPGLLLHVHLHARAVAAAARPGPQREDGRRAAGVSKEYGASLNASLRSAVGALRTPRPTSAWTAYRARNTYTEQAAADKLGFVRDVVELVAPARALDLGANDGFHAMALAKMGVSCTAVEMDPACAEALYAASATPPFDGLVNTLRVDISNPTPAHGWAHEERASFAARMRCDLTLSLALVHHLSITHQVPFVAIAEYLGQLAPHAIVEYVPVDDPMAQRLLEARTAITPSYLETLSEAAFATAFDARFECVRRSQSVSGGRVLYHFRHRDAAAP